ncbi:hypothetical protein ACSSV6_002139 [Roseovarius sp. MBR-38]|jgi:hypothetical protein
MRQNLADASSDSGMFTPGSSRTGPGAFRGTAWAPTFPNVKGGRHVSTGPRPASPTRKQHGPLQCADRGRHGPWGADRAACHHGASGRAPRIWHPRLPTGGDPAGRRDQPPRKASSAATRRKRRAEAEHADEKPRLKVSPAPPGPPLRPGGDGLSVGTTCSFRSRPHTPPRHRRNTDAPQPSRATRSWHGQVTRWSLTMPTACMKA